MHVLYRQIHCCRCAGDINNWFRQQISSCLCWSRPRTFFSAMTATNVLRSNTVAQEKYFFDLWFTAFFSTHSWLEMHLTSWVLASVLTVFFITAKWASLQLNTKAGPKRSAPYVTVLQRTASSVPTVTWLGFMSTPSTLLCLGQSRTPCLACVSEWLNMRKRLR